MNSVVLVGRLTKDFELRYIPGSNTAVATSTIAVDRDYTKKDGSKETDFVPIEVIGKSAEYCANYLGKGRLVSLQGNIKVDNYQDQQGNNKTFTKVSTMRIQSLEKNPNGNSNSNSNNQNNNRQNQGFDSGFQAVDNMDDIPF